MAEIQHHHASRDLRESEEGLWFWKSTTKAPLTIWIKLVIGLTTLRGFVIGVQIVHRRRIAYALL